MKKDEKKTTNSFYYQLFANISFRKLVEKEFSGKLKLDGEK